MLGWLIPSGSNSNLDKGTGRRQILQESVAVGAALWVSIPGEAEAFRVDRILNAKRRYIPKIRAYYQKLEGLRDDLTLQIEYKDGPRKEFQARVAEWYDGLDSKMDGPLVLPGDGDLKFGCSSYTLEQTGAVVLIARGRCTFAEKMAFAKAAGAKSVVLYDEKMSKMALDQQSRTGLVNSKGVSNYEAGDALTGASTVPKENGITIMGVEAQRDAKPTIDAVMISRANGTTLVNSILEGKEPRILDVKRFKFQDGIDAFIKKDLPKMLKEMEIYSTSQRMSKDDIQDPIVVTLKKDREDFEKAVKAKDYGEIRRTFTQWNSDFDEVARWDLAELV